MSAPTACAYAITDANRLKSSQIGILSFSKWSQVHKSIKAVEAAGAEGHAISRMGFFRRPLYHRSGLLNNF